jgi:hypothetical protein
MIRILGLSLATAIIVAAPALAPPERTRTTCRSRPTMHGASARMARPIATNAARFDFQRQAGVTVSRATRLR